MVKKKNEKHPKKFKKKKSPSPGKGKSRVENDPVKLNHFDPLVRVVNSEIEYVRDIFYRRPRVQLFERIDPQLPLLAANVKLPQDLRKNINRFLEELNPEGIRPDQVPVRAHGFCADKTYYLAMRLFVVLDRYIGLMNSSKLRRGQRPVTDYSDTVVRILLHNLEDEVQNLIQQVYYGGEKLTGRAIENVKIVRTDFLWSQNFRLSKEDMTYLGILVDGSESEIGRKDLPDDHYYLKIRHPGRRNISPRKIDTSFCSYFSTYHFPMTPIVAGWGNTKTNVKSVKGARKTRSERQFNLDDEELLDSFRKYPARGEFHDRLDHLIKKINDESASMSDQDKLEFQKQLSAARKYQLEYNEVVYGKYRVLMQEVRKYLPI